MKRKTAAEIAAETGRGISAIAKRWKKNFPSVPFSASAELSEEQAFVLSGGMKRKSAPNKNQPETKTPAQPKETTAKVAPGKTPKWVKWVAFFALGAMLITSTSASVYNIHKVCVEIADPVSAYIMTCIFSFGAIGFVAVGVKGRYTWAIVFLLLAFEAVCNMVCVYGGLVNWSVGYPTLFLSTVCDYFNTGTYIMARILSILTALTIAGVQYAAIYQINKHAQ